MDILKQGAIVFQKLLKCEYEIVAGSKQKLLKMILFFSKGHFMHLIGLHKLTDLQISLKKIISWLSVVDLTFNYCKM